MMKRDTYLIFFAQIQRRGMYTYNCTQPMQWTISGPRFWRRITESMCLSTYLEWTGRIFSSVKI